MPKDTFTTDSFRDQTFDLLSGIAHDPGKLDEFTTAYLTKLHDDPRNEQMRHYARDLYNRILGKYPQFIPSGDHPALFFFEALQPVQANTSVHMKGAFHEKIIVVLFWTFSNIHSLQMMSKLIAIDKHYSTAGVGRPLRSRFCSCILLFPGDGHRCSFAEI